MKFENTFFINGTAYAGKSTMVKRLAEKYDGIACEENYHNALLSELDRDKFPCLTYTRDLQDWHDFIRRTPDEYEAWVRGVSKECEDISVNRFFERADREKQFLYQLLMDEESPKLAIENFRQCLRRINSRENYDSFLHSGFRVIVRDENRGIEETFSLVEKELGLQR